MSGDSTPPAADPLAPDAHAAPRRRGLVLGIAAAVLLPIALAATTIGGAWWALRSTSGSSWLLGHVPGLKVTRPQGALVGDFAADRVELRIDRSGLLRIDGLRWRGLEIGRAPAHLWLRVGIAELSATRVDWQAGATVPGTPPSAPPNSLGLPVEIDVGALRIGQISRGADDATPVRDLEAALHLGADLGAVHRIERLALTWARVRLTGSGQIATGAPLQLESRLEAAQQVGNEGPAWTASAHAAGPLATPLVEVTVRSQPAANDRPAQALDLRATLKPFAAWPLGDLQLGLKALDLSAFDAALPVTALSGTAIARTRALDQPSELSAEIANSAAGRWNEGRLPVRRLVVDLRARPDDLGNLELQTFAAELGSAVRPAGRIEGRGHWTAERWNVDAVLADVQAERLDGRAPVLTVSGPLTLSAGGAGPASARPIEAKGILQGQLASRGPMRSVRAALDLSLSPQRIEVRAAELRAAEAIASLSGTAVRASTADAWQIQGKASLVDFDPAPWLPADTEPSWRKGPHRLNGNGSFDVAVPDSIATLTFYPALAALHGDATLTLANSQLAGIALRADATWHNRAGTPALAYLALDAGGNGVRLEGRIGPGADGAADAWEASIAAPALNRLAPLWRLGSTAGSAAAAAPAGALDARAQISGRWPALSTRGELDASGVRVGALGMRRAQARWQLGTTIGAPLALDATLTQAAWGGPSVESVQARLSGTGAAHRLDVRIESKALPPAWTDALQGAPAPSAAATVAAAPASAAVGVAPASAAVAAAPASAAASPPALAAVSPAARSLALLQAEGGLVGSARGGVTGWRGTVKQLEARNAADSAAAWVRARDLGIETQWAGGPMRIAIQPGRAEILGAALRWSRFAWQAAAGPQAPMRFDVDAELDPLPVAPLLRRLQPAFGWGGDLTMAGHFAIHSAPAVTADVVVERRAGDLTVTDETGTQALGLSTLRLGIAAADGVWNFTQALAGRTIGVAAGAIVARTPAGATWPSAATPLQGVVELQVANLGTWGTWVPAGWRLGGELRVSASIGGRVGAPEYTGEVVGRSLSVRNFLEGVSIADGDVAIALRGTSARIERFSARAGSGNVTLEGEASLGEAPQARLRLAASKFQVLGRVDRRIVASGTAQLRLERDVAAVEGRFTVDEGLIDFSRSDAPSLSDDVHVIRRKPGAPPPRGSPEAAAIVQTSARDAAPATAPVRSLALDLQVGMGEHLRVHGRGLDAGLRGNLRITSPAGRLAVNGTVYTVDGTYAAYGQKLTIDRGQLAFSGAIENPRLDIEATRPNLDVRVGVAVAGGALNPRIRLFSEPDMTEIDKLSWLVLGRASEGLGRADTALLQRAALALLAGEGSGGGISDRAIKSLGLDEVSLRQSDGEVRETIVSLGKQLSRRWYVGYERGLNATAGSWQLIYRVARRFTLRAQSGADNSVDAIWTWRWQ